MRVLRVGPEPDRNFGDDGGVRDPAAVRSLLPVNRSRRSGPETRAPALSREAAAIAAASPVARDDQTDRPFPENLGIDGVHLGRMDRPVVKPLPEQLLAARRGRPCRAPRPEQLLQPAGPPRPENSHSSARSSASSNRAAKHLGGDLSGNSRRDAGSAFHFVRPFSSLGDEPGRNAATPFPLKCGPLPQRPAPPESSRSARRPQESRAACGCSGTPLPRSAGSGRSEPGVSSSEAASAPSVPPRVKRKRLPPRLETLLGAGECGERDEADPLARKPRRDPVERNTRREVLDDHPRVHAPGGTRDP